MRGVPRSAPPPRQRRPALCPLHPRPLTSYRLARRQKVQRRHRAPRTKATHYPKLARLPPQELQPLPRKGPLRLPRLYTLTLPNRRGVAPRHCKAPILREGRRPEGEARKAQPQEGLEQQTEAPAVNPHRLLRPRRGRRTLRDLPPGRVLPVEQRAGQAAAQTASPWAGARAAAPPWLASDPQMFPPQTQPRRHEELRGAVRQRRKVYLSSRPL